MRQPHTGTVTATFAGEVVTIRMTWAVMSALHGRFGESWDQDVEAAMTSLDPARMAEVLGMASDRPADWWMDASPPVKPVIDAMRDAISTALLGPGGGQDQSDPLMTPSGPLASLWAWLSASGAGSAATRKPSGA